jgi:long-chain acyl-CoA synthetase
MSAPTAGAADSSGPSRPATLARLAEQAAERLADHDALWFEGQVHRSHRLLDRASRVGAGLRALGLAPGERVVVLMANCPEVGVTYQAVWRAGGVVTPVVFLVTAVELRHILTDSAATLVVTTADLLPKVTEAADGLAGLRIVVVGARAGSGTGTGTGAATLDFAELEAAEPRGLVDRDPDDLAALLYTGGTTGRAKGVMLSHANLSWVGSASYAAGHIDGVTRTLLPLPISHAYGLIVTITGMYSREPGLAVLMRWFEPDAFLSLCVDHRVQRTALVPAMVQLLLGRDLESLDLSQLSTVGVGAAPIAADTIAEFERRVPSATVLVGYGCTESGAVISTNPPAARRLGSVGRPLPGLEVQIRADGEIAVRSPGVMPGYWHSPEASAATLAGGWLHTGDIGRLDDDGYLYVVDRKKDLIIRGGFNVYPRDVEDVLLEHPAVALAGCVGRPDPVLGEEVVAFVSLHPGATPVDGPDLVGFARERLSATKYPREVRILATVPLTSVGKLDRKALRALL